MSVRTWSIRSRLVALVAVPIVCLVLFWGFANYLTLGDGVRLYNQSRLVDELTVPLDNVVIAVQAERRAGMVYLAKPNPTHQQQLADARKTADRKIAAFRSGLSSDTVRSVATDRMLTLAQRELADLSGLTDLRSRLDHRSITPAALMTGTDDLLAGVDPLYTQVTSFPDEATAAEGGALAMLSRAREARSATDAVLAYALARGHFTPDTYRLFLQTTGIEQDRYAAATEALPSADRHAYDAVTAKAPFPELAAMERTAIEKGGPTSQVPVNETQWRQANARGLAAQYRFEQHLYDLLGQHAKAPSYLIFLRLGLAGLLGLIAIVISVLVARRLTRALIRQLRALRDSARDLAWVRLPAVVQRLSDGQTVDVAAEVPALPAGSDEIGQVSEAFNEVGRTAVQAASGQAELRSGTATMFLNIARRSQTLLHRQLSQLDVMERKAAEPEALDDLFKIDHLATRMRRNAENLVILGGGTPGRVWSEPKPLLDVLRSAASEVEQYERVHVLPFRPTLLVGSVVSDIVHLVAELIDNATAFSPPHTRVNVTGQPVPKGFAIEIEDRGLGMSADDIDAINQWLARPPSFDVLALNDDARLGMFVVARLAARHDIKVQLRPSPYGGTTAIVLLPAELVQQGEDEEPPPEPTDRGAPVLVAAGAHRAGTGAASGTPRLAALGTLRRSAADADPPVPPPRPEPAPAETPSDPAPAEPEAETAEPEPETGSGTTEGIDSERPEPEPYQYDAGEVAETVPFPRTATDTEAGGPAPSDIDDDQTHLGLPRRVRQASLAPGLRTDPAVSTAATAPPAVAGRSPEEIRQMMSSYQQGTRRGRRTDAAGSSAPTPGAENGREDG